MSDTIKSFEKAGDNFIIDLKKCSRCGGKHENIVFERLTNPITMNVEKEFTHYTLCPETHEPLLLFSEDLPVENYSISKEYANYLRRGC